MSTPDILNAHTYLVTGTAFFGPMLRRGRTGFTNQEWIRMLEAELLRRARLSA